MYRLLAASFLLTFSLWLSRHGVSAHDRTPSASNDTQESSNNSSSGFLVRLIRTVVLAAFGGLAYWTIRSKDAQIEHLQIQIASTQDTVAQEQEQARRIGELGAKIENLLEHQTEAEDSAASPAAIQEALDVYEKALALDPGDPDTPTNRGIVLVRMGHNDEALAAFSKALALEPSHGNALYNRACLYSLQEQPDNALEDLRLAIDADAKYQQMAQADSDFHNIRNDPRFQQLVGEVE